MAMKKVTLGVGKAALEVSAIGYGAMGLTAFYDPIPTEEHGLKVLRAAYDAGVRHFDTAQVYARMEEDKTIVYNEDLIGKFLKSLTEEEKTDVSVATKFMPWTRDMKLLTEFDEESFFKACDDSLKRLGVDSIDLYYLHRIFPKEVEVKTWMAGFKTLYDQGKIKRVGLSEASARVIREANEIHPITCIQQEWSLFARDLEQDLVPVCRELGIGIVAYSPVGRGFLAGKFETETPVGYRANVPYLSEENREKNNVLLTEIKTMAAKKGCTANQLCLAWLVAKGGVPIPGSSKIAHVESNCTAEKVELTEDDVRALDVIGDKVSGLRASPERIEMSYHGNL
eukprot:snap_masked-scaffold_12-processed-gene-1.26-mRNA-1 protein AED:0.06 eAED:0.06 QI:0/-1/0/1/-1/1/1/0/339